MKLHQHLCFVLTMYFAAVSATAEVPSGTQLRVRTIDRIDSKTAEVGQSYRASLDEAVRVGGDEIAPKGADCILRIEGLKEAGAVSGKTELRLVVAQLRVKGELKDITTAPASMESKSKAKKTGMFGGLGAAAGAGLGGMMGGAKGAVVGAGAGAAAGVATAAVLSGPEVKVAPETVLQFVVK